MWGGRRRRDGGRSSLQRMLLRCRRLGRSRLSRNRRNRRGRPQELDVRQFLRGSRNRREFWKDGPLGLRRRGRNRESLDVYRDVSRPRGRKLHGRRNDAGDLFGQRRSRRKNRLSDLSPRKRNRRRRRRCGRRGNWRGGLRAKKGLLLGQAVQKVGLGRLQFGNTSVEKLELSRELQNPVVRLPKLGLGQRLPRIEEVGEVLLERGVLEEPLCRAREIVVAREPGHFDLQFIEQAVSRRELGGRPGRISPKDEAREVAHLAGRQPAALFAGRGGLAGADKGGRIDPGQSGERVLIERAENPGVLIDPILPHSESGYPRNVTDSRQGAQPSPPPNSPMVLKSGPGSVSASLCSSWF